MQGFIGKKIYGEKNVKKIQIQKLVNIIVQCATMVTQDVTQ